MDTTVDITEPVMAFLRERQHERGLQTPLQPSTPVFSSGLLDSVSLMALVVAVEQTSGQTLDMLRFDPSGVETLDDLVQSLTAALGA